METKPIVTCHGNMVLFSSLHPAILHSLPKEPAEWRRSYGRPPRNVYLEASFVPYDDDILPEDTDKTLISRPYFHIYWTDCDVETYKQSVREEISDWCAALKARNIPDWLIVIVNSDDSKAKSKLLPRTSLHDKVKSDWCSKQPDRCIVLTDPLKTEPRNLELWNVFQSRLRQFLLQAFSRHLQKYEDNMRALREKRSEFGWNFQEYFIVQEELAFMFEMLELYEDALIQYDELDALFTQFVLNHASGEPVPWLKSLISPCKSWVGLSLRKPIAWDKRNMIKDNEASLLTFRNYLFSRQCALLCLMKRPGEIVQRALDYLHNTVQEIKTLNVSMPEGSLDCWVFLSGREVLQKCENLTDNLKNRTQGLHTATLWDYVCRKLRRLGELCGLMPDMDSQPTSAQLSLVIDLTAGMGLVADTGDDDDEASKQLTPRDTLRGALSSRGSFQKIYLEMSELTMGTFKHIGRFRSARMIGKNLAEFYMKLNEPLKAENFLLDAMKSYHQEGWRHLTEMSRLELARCQHDVGDHFKYVKTACQVAGSASLDMADRAYHMSQVLEVATHTTVGPIYLKASPLLQFHVLEKDISQKTALDDTLHIHLVVTSNAPCELNCDSIWLTLVDCDPVTESVISNHRLGSMKVPVYRQISNVSLDERNVMSLEPVQKRFPALINLRTHYEGDLSSLEATGIACVNTQELLKRNDSFGSNNKTQEERLIKDDASWIADSKNVILKQGENVIQLTTKATMAGSFRLGQAGVKVKSVELLKDMDTDVRIYVDGDEIGCQITPELVLAGATQTVTVHLHTGSSTIDAGSKVKVIPSAGLTVAIGEDGGDTVCLEAAGRGTVVDWAMKLSQEARSDRPEKFENKIAFDCSWLPRPLITTVTFQNPITVKHLLKTAREQKYIQIVMQGNCETMFTVQNWRLEATNTPNVELRLIGMAANSVRHLNQDQSLSCLWQVKSNIAEYPDLDLEFTLEYRCSVGGEPFRQMPYTFSLENYQTLFSISVDVKPADHDKVCKTGTLACMTIQVTATPACKLPFDQEYMYEVTDEEINTQNWTVHGKSSGVFVLPKGASSSVELDVMPLTTGFLPVPRIQLMAYKSNFSEEDMWAKKADLALEEDLDGYQDDDHSDSDDGESSTPHHTEFSPGQVYYSSLGKQVHVYPDNSSGDVEVTVI